MDTIAHQLTKYSIWLMPVAWLAIGGLAWSTHRAAAFLFIWAGLSGLLWNFLYLPVDGIQPSMAYWNATAIVPYSDAPIGHVLSVYLPLLSKLAVIGGVLLSIRKA